MHGNRGGPELFAIGAGSYAIVPAFRCVGLIRGETAEGASLRMMGRLAPPDDGDSDDGLPARGREVTDGC